MRQRAGERVRADKGKGEMGSEKVGWCKEDCGGGARSMGEHKVRRLAHLAYALALKLLLN